MNDYHGGSHRYAPSFSMRTVRTEDTGARPANETARRQQHSNGMAWAITTPGFGPAGPLNRGGVRTKQCPLLQFQQSFVSAADKTCLTVEAAKGGHASYAP